MDSIGSRATRRIGEVRHTSGHRWCAPRRCPALVSVIERAYAGRVLRSVVWCSLRGSDQHCAETCLIDPLPTGGARADEAALPQP